MSSNSKGWAVAGGIAALAIIFQVFFRYEYLHLEGGRIDRIDRLTQQVCTMGANPLLVSNACTEATEQQKEDYAISLAQAAGSTGVVTDDQVWRADLASTQVSDGSTVADDTYLICHCDPKGTGWRWEVRLSTKEAISVTKDSPLSKRYGLVWPK